MDSSQLAVLALSRALDGAFRTLAEMQTALALATEGTALRHDVQVLLEAVELDARALHLALERHGQAALTDELL